MSFEWTFCDLFFVLIVPFAIDKMADFSCANTVKALTEHEVNKLSNAQLKKALWTILSVEEPTEQKSYDLLKTLITNQEKHFQIVIDTMRETAHTQQLRTESDIFDLNKRCDAYDKKMTDLTIEFFNEGVVSTILGKLRCGPN